MRQQCKKKKSLLSEISQDFEKLKGALITRTMESETLGGWEVAMRHSKKTRKCEGDCFAREGEV